MAFLGIANDACPLVRFRLLDDHHTDYCPNATYPAIWTTVHNRFLFEKLPLKQDIHHS